MNKKFWLLAGLALVAVAIIWVVDRSSVDSDDRLRISGNIEVTEVRASFRLPGRLKERLVDEGDQVAVGQPIGRLDTNELTREVSQRIAERDGAAAAFKEVQNGYLPEELAQARAKRDEAQADYQRLDVELNRQKTLLQQEVVSKREFDLDQASYEVAKARLQESSKALALLERGIRQERIDQAAARLKQSEEALEISKARLGYAELRAPIKGWVLSRSAEAGEYVQAGTPIVTIGDLASVWFRGYISEQDLGRVKLGDSVNVTTDTFPNKVYEGKITFISQEAEFTPKNIQTAKERVKLVYRIKVTLRNADGELKPGMPAEGIIITHVESGTNK